MGYSYGGARMKNHRNVNRKDNDSKLEDSTQRAELEVIASLSGSIRGIFLLLVSAQVDCLITSAGTDFECQETTYSEEHNAWTGKFLCLGAWKID